MVSEADFIRVSLRRQELNAGFADIPGTLNELQSDGDDVGGDEGLIDAVDALMDGLYQTDRLSEPGHRWLSCRVPSIRGNLNGLYRNGHLGRAPDGRWTSSYTCLYCVILGG